jgi:hypothetical protein
MSGHRRDGESLTPAAVASARATLDRARASGRPADWDRAATAWGDVVEVLAEDDRNRAQLLSEAAGVLLERCQTAGEHTADLDTACRWLLDAVAAAEASRASRPSI